MATLIELQINAEAVGALKTIDNVQKAVNVLKNSSPIKLSIEAGQIDKVTKNMIALAKAQTKLAVEQEKTKQEHEKTVQAIQKTIQANEKSTQALEKTAQAQAKVNIEQERTIQTQERTSQALERTYQAEERTTQALERSKQAVEKTTQAKERTAQATEKTRQEELKLQTEQEKTNRAMQSGSTAANAFAVALGSIASRAFHMALMKVRQAIREAVEEMKSVDTELTNISKVSGKTGADLEAIGDKAYDTASKYGVAASEYLSAVYEFQKAGMGDASETLGELAIKTQLVGDTSAETASKFLLATNAAWELNGNVEALNKVIDQADYINNNYATSLDKLADGMPIVASTAANMNMSIEETFAVLGTITSKTQETGRRAATAWRSLVMNITKEIGTITDEYGEEITVTEEGVKTLTDALKIYGNEAVKTAIETGKVIDPMEAVNSLAQAYKDGLVNDIELTNILMGLGGKLRTNQIVALIKDIASETSTYKSIMEGLPQAAGTADKEIELMLSGWERKTQVLKNTWTEFIADLVDTDTIKGAVDVLTDVVDGMDRLIQSKSEALHETEAALESYYAEIAELESRQGALTFWEKERLAYLKLQTEELEKQKQKQAQQALNSAWTKYDAFTDTVMGTSEIYGGFLGDIGIAQGKAAKSHDLAAYQSELKGIAEAYSDIYRATIDARDAHISLSTEQEQFIRDYESLYTAASASEKEINQATNGLKINQDLYKFYKQDLDSIREKNQDAADSAAGISYDGAAESAQRLLDILTQIGGLISLSGLPHMATGGVSGGGRTLVNELGPELISDRGRAYIANGGRPGVVNLSRGAIVIPAGQTRSILRSGGMPTRSAAFGLNNKGVSLNPGPTADLSPYVGSLWPETNSTEAVDPVESIMRPYWSAGRGQSGYGAVFYDPEGLLPGKSNGGVTGSGNGGAGNGGSYKDVKALAKELSSLLTNLEKQATLAGNEQDWVRQAEIYEQMQEAIKQMVDDYREAGYADDSDEILDLLNKNYDIANKQLTLYQTKWDELIKALDSDTAATEAANKLAEKQQAVDEAREALANAQRQRTVRIFNAATGQWEWVADQSKVASAEKSVATAEKNYTDTVKSEALSELKRLKESAADLTDVVLGPALSTVAQMAESAQEFQNFARALDAVYGVGTFLNSTEGSTKALSTVDSHDTVYSFNGLKLTDAQAQSMTVAELAKSLSILNLTV